MRLLAPIVREPGRSPSGRIWFAQALRGLACLMVVWSHLAEGFGFAQDIVAPRAFAEPILGIERPVWYGFSSWLYGFHTINFGSTAVAFFFLISGFVIPYSLDHGHAGIFVIRRFFRLYPTLWACMAVTAVITAIWADHRGVPFPHDVHDFASSAGLVAGYTGNHFIDGVYWTLAAEELFYIVAAILAWRRLLTSPWAILGAGGLLALAAAVFEPSFNGNTFGFWFSRNATLVIFVLVGVALHHVYRRFWDLRTCVGVIFGLLIMFEIAANSGAQVADLTMTANGLFALLIFVTLLVFNERLPYSRAVDWSANISYPLYALHAGIGWILLYALYPKLGQNVYLTVFATIAIVVVLATIVHFAVERPTMRLGRSLDKRLLARRAHGLDSPPVPPAGQDVTDLVPEPEGDDESSALASSDGGSG